MSSHAPHEMPGEKESTAGLAQFPIRFDLLDTMVVRTFPEVHPLTEYIYENLACHIRRMRATIFWMPTGRVNSSAPSVPGSKYCVVKVVFQPGAVPPPRVQFRPVLFLHLFYLGSIARIPVLPQHPFEAAEAEMPFFGFRRPSGTYRCWSLQPNGSFRKIQLHPLDLPVSMHVPTQSGRPSAGHIFHICGTQG